MAAVCAVYECGDDKDRAKTFCVVYVKQLLSLPEVNLTSMSNTAKVSLENLKVYLTNLIVMTS